MKSKIVLLCAAVTLVACNSEPKLDLSGIQNSCEDETKGEVDCACIVEYVEENLDAELLAPLAQGAIEDGEDGLERVSDAFSKENKKMSRRVFKDGLEACQ
ncbi:hypothetical protein [Hirschia baltica]|uniref:Lipoprotein n=1 Tax=Hirschia baltica (strain ATCC 49814 / DSM 5838 / IFAM 1418) TaxID=582402 RepID=C6XPF0_HIRBI|nr:hypothetical protein [Hirschia baltica]ACT58436.1 hypothetical protein Hbal_0742 [Hirschia baltica ATCC 49814]